MEKAAWRILDAAIFLEGFLQTFEISLTIETALYTMGSIES
jgi:hypothetical protein